MNIRKVLNSFIDKKIFKIDTNTMQPIVTAVKKQENEICSKAVELAGNINKADLKISLPKPSFIPNRTPNLSATEQLIKEAMSQGATFQEARNGAKVLMNATKMQEFTPSAQISAQAIEESRFFKKADIEDFLQAYGKMVFHN